MIVPLMSYTGFPTDRTVHKFQYVDTEFDL